MIECLGGPIDGRTFDDEEVPELGAEFWVEVGDPHHITFGVPIVGPALVPPRGCQGRHRYVLTEDGYQYRGIVSG